MTQQTLANASEQVYAQAGIANLYVDGMHVASASNTTLTVGSGQCRDSSNVYDMFLDTTKTINAAVNGLNGLDQGTFAASTVYSVFVVADPSGFKPTGTILSASSTPTLPFGYGIYRRIGYYVTDSSVHFIPMHISGNESTRICMYESAVSVQTTGADTSLTGIDLSAAVPAVERVPVYINYNYTPHAAGETLKFAYSGATQTTNLETITGQVASVNVTGQLFMFSTLVAGVPKIDYEVSVAT